MSKRKSAPRLVLHTCVDDSRCCDCEVPCECALGADHTHDQWADSGLPDGHVFEAGETDE